MSFPPILNKIIRTSFYFLLAFIVLSCSHHEIIEKSLDFNKERIQLSLKYLNERYGIIEDFPVIKPQMVVVHWTAIPTFEKSYQAFRDPTLPESRKGIADAGALNVSAQYLIDRGGEIYQLMPDTLMARHVIGLNHCSIGIENVGGTPDTPLTKAQLKANTWLIHKLYEKYPISYVIGHYEYTLFENHPLWKEVDDNYRTEKTDPGIEFMADLRKSLSDLNLKKLPE